MKILHVINSFDVGGAERLVCSYILESKDKHENYTMTLKDSKSFLNDILTEGGVKQKSLNNTIKIKKLFNLIKEINRENYDVVHAHLFPSNYYCAIASIFCRNSKFVFTEHSITNKRRRIKLLRPIERKMYRCFDKIIACADKVNRELVKWTGKDIEIITINNGIRDSVLSQEEQQYDLILIGSLRSDVKGVDILLRSLSLIKGRITKAIIVGEGIEIDNLLKLRSSLGLDDKVDFLGIRDDVENLLNKSKIFVMPSRYEGLPLSLLEAMSLRKAIIASDVGDIPKIINDKESGIIINNNNIEELSKAIIVLLENEDERVRLGKNAYKEFKDNYSIKNYCRNIDNLYEEVIN